MGFYKFSYGTQFPYYHLLIRFLVYEFVKTLHREADFFLALGLETNPSHVAGKQIKYVLQFGASIEN